MSEKKVKFDIVKKPKHYNSHPSGVECIFITGILPGAVSNAWKYMWRLDLKLNTIQDLEKCIQYLDFEIRERLHHKRGTYLAYNVDYVWSLVQKILPFEHGARRKFFLHAFNGSLLQSSNELLLARKYALEILNEQKKKEI